MRKISLSVIMFFGFVPMAFAQFAGGSGDGYDRAFLLGASFNPSAFIVINTSDSDAGSLRQAIMDANASPGLDLIEFDIPGTGPHTIASSSVLPEVTDPVIIDAESQHGASCSTHTLQVVLDGASIGGGGPVFGLVLGANSEGSAVRGLVIIRFGRGIVIHSNDNVVECNLVGTDGTSDPMLGNIGDGVYIESGSSNLIGGFTADARNVISENGAGLRIIDGNSNVVAGNFIGTDVTGLSAFGNSGSGIHISSGTDNTIGETVAGARNVISNNDGFGVFLESGGNRVQGNYIGTDATGTVEFGNRQGGVWIRSASENMIGGSVPGAGNLISGHISGTNEDGVLIEADGNTVQGNLLGTDVSGTADLGNQAGVRIVGNNNLIGGTIQGSGNVISGNSSGVDIRGNDNMVQGNLIGTDVSGMATLGNSGTGIHVIGLRNVIGGTVPGSGNVISASVQEGVHLRRGNANVSGSTTIVGNYIGTDVSGLQDAGNGKDGILAEEGVGSSTITDNVIAFNGRNGVTLAPSASFSHRMEDNSFFENAGLGIDLGDDGPTANDPGDADTGTNRLQNTPSIVEAFIFADGDVILTYVADSDPAYSAYPLSVEVYAADADAEEGETLLGRDDYSVNDYNFCTAPPCEKTVNLGSAADLGITANDFLVATATDSDGNTSEFSAPAFDLPPAVPGFSIAGAVLRPDDS